jgi:hypothetical protein
VRSLWIVVLAACGGAAPRPVVVAKPEQPPPVSPEPEPKGDEPAPEPEAKPEVPETGKGKIGRASWGD